MNHEQSPKPAPTATPTQETIDRAFTMPQRHSNSTLSYNGRTIVLLSGKHSGNLGVGTVRGVGRGRLPATGLERTLIDMVVRPSYSGRSPAILEAFIRAKTKLSPRTLVATLNKLQLIYPYHQAIGFFMDSAGYGLDATEPLRHLGLALEFYTEHAIQDTAYDARWRVHYPRTLHQHTS